MYIHRPPETLILEDANNFIFPPMRDDDPIKQAWHKFYELNRKFYAWLRSGEDTYIIDEHAPPCFRLYEVNFFKSKGQKLEAPRFVRAIYELKNDAAIEKFKAYKTQLDELLANATAGERKDKKRRGRKILFIEEQVKSFVVYTQNTWNSIPLKKDTKIELVRKIKLPNDEESEEKVLSYLRHIEEHFKAYFPSISLQLDKFYARIFITGQDVFDFVESDNIRMRDKPSHIYQLRTFYQPEEKKANKTTPYQLVILVPQKNAPVVNEPKPRKKGKLKIENNYKQIFLPDLPPKPEDLPIEVEMDKLFFDMNAPLK